MEKIIQQIQAQAKLLGACDKLTGQETTIQELIPIFLSFQGLEFCIKHGFPSLNTFRLLREMGYDLRPHGIYIDAGTIRLKNEKKIILIGKTTATVIYDTCEHHSVTIMHGAKAVVNAMKWAVVHTHSDNHNNVMRNISDNAIII